MEWRIHKSKQLSVIVWVDKKTGLICLRWHLQSMGPMKSVQLLRGMWDIYERRLRYFPCTFNRSSLCDEWMSPTNLKAKILVKFALTNDGIGFFFLLGHHAGQHVKTSLSPVFCFKNKNLESQMLSTPFGKGFSITPPPIPQLHFSFQSSRNIFSHAHVESFSQSMLWMSYTVPNILPMLLWAPHPHWKVLEDGSLSNFLLKVIFFTCKI